MVEEHLKSRAAAFAGLTELIFDRFHFGEAPQNTQTPYVVFDEVTYLPVSAMGNDTGLSQSRFQVDSYAATRDVARAVAKQVRLAFQRYGGTINGNTIQQIFVLGRFGLKEPDTKLFRVSQDFMVHHVEV